MSEPVSVTIGPTPRRLLRNPERCPHPLEARQLGGPSHATIICMLCGTNALALANQPTVGPLTRVALGSQRL